MLRWNLREFVNLESNTILTPVNAKQFGQVQQKKINEKNVVMHPKNYIAEQWVKNS